LYKLESAGLITMRDASTLAVHSASRVRDVESELRSTALAARADQGDFVATAHAFEHVVHKLDGEGLSVSCSPNAKASRACRRRLGHPRTTARRLKFPEDAGAQDHAAAAALQTFTDNHLTDLQAVRFQKLAPARR